MKIGDIATRAGLIVSLAVSLIVSVLDFSGLISGVIWLESRIPTMTLLAVAMILLFLLIEHKTKLENIERLLVERRIEYLSNNYIVVAALEETATNATRFIYALGGKSEATTYLARLQARVLANEVEYYRVVAGDHITHTLHMHLDALLDCENAHLAWTESEKFGGFVVSDHDVLVLLASPRPDFFSAIRMRDQDSLWLYHDWFLRILNESHKISSRDIIRALCEKCAPKELKRNVQRIAELAGPSAHQ